VIGVEGRVVVASISTFLDCAAAVALPTGAARPASQPAYPRNASCKPSASLVSVIVDTSAWPAGEYDPDPSGQENNGCEGGGSPCP